MYTKAEVFSSSNNTTVEVGGFYSRLHEMNITDTAEVIALSDDHAGVPHVRFSLVSSLGPRVVDCGTKTLAVEAFLQTYSPCEKKSVRPTNVTHLKSHI